VNLAVIWWLLPNTSELTQIFVCMKKKNCKNWIKILGATLHNLVNQNLGTSTLKYGEHLPTNTAPHPRRLESSAALL